MAVLTNTMMQGTAAISDDESYQIEKSLRFKRADSAWLKKVDNTGNRRQWTWSGWVKKTDLTNGQTLFSGTVGTGSQVAGSLEVRIVSGTQFYIAFCESNGSALQWSAEDKAYYRDPAAWQHWVIVLDTPNATATERFRVYVNGKKVEDWGTRNTVTQNFEYGINKSGAYHLIGVHYSGENLQEHFDGYFSNVEFIDGLCLSPAAFGSFDSTGVWNPKAFALPAPNDGTTWSNGTFTLPDSSNAAVTWHNNAPVTRLFDGDVTSTTNAYPSTTVRWEWTIPDIPCNSTFRMSKNSAGTPGTSTLTTDTGSVSVTITSPGSQAWVDFPLPKGTTKLTKLLVPGSTNNWIDVGGFEVDGVILVDGQTDPTTRNNPNNNITWSTGGANWNSGSSTSAFNGNLSDGPVFSTGYSTLTSSDIVVGSKIRIKTNSGSGTETVKDGDGNEYALDLQTTETWRTLWNANSQSGTPYTGTLAGPVYIKRSTGTSYCYAIEVDGHILIDGAKDNSFHLKFDDTSTNAALGTDSLNDNDFTVNNLTTNLDAAATGEITAKSTATTTLNKGMALNGDESLTRDWGSQGDSTKRMLFATWFKTTSTEDYFLCSGAGTGGNHSIMRFESADVFQIYNYEFSAAYGGFGVKWDISDLSLQDGNWHHFMLNVNTTNSTGKYRMQIYFDGVQRGVDVGAGGVISGEDNFPGHNNSFGYWNQNVDHKLGDQTYENKNSTMSFAETYFLDGSNNWNPTPTFIQSDGRPQPEGTPDTTLSDYYGSKGFYLAYENSNALGNDESGNNNDWTTNGSPDHLTSGLPSVSIDTLTLASSDNFTRLATGTTYNQSDSNAAGELKTIDSGNKQLVFKTSSGTWSANTGKTVTIPAVTTGDDFTDTPTNYGTDTGLGGEVRGNYATWNPLQQVSGSNNGGTVNEGNLHAYCTYQGVAGVTSTIGANTGKFYAEFEITGSTNWGGVGVVTTDQASNDTTNEYGWAKGPWGWIKHNNNGNIYTNTGNVAATSVTYTFGDIIGIAIDLDAGKIWWAKNGVWDSDASSNVGNPGTGANPTVSYTADTSKIFLFAYHGWGSASGTLGARANFGQRTFKYTNNRAGFKALCTQNLEDIFSGDALNDSSYYFDVKTYEGTGASHDIKGLKFQPDLVWLKERDATGDPYLFDAVRGATKAYWTSLTTAETTEGTSLTAFNSDGFTLGTGADVNADGQDMVTWTWDAGSAASGANTNGSINVASGDQWVNNTSGFSITKYEGTGANATVGHGLSTPPEMIIIKGNGDLHWPVYTKDRGATHYWLFDVFNNAADLDTYWQDTAPTNTVFSIGTSVFLNQNGTDFMAYCFTSIPGYSKVGSYTGTGVDPNFVYLGFSPKYLLIKGDIQGENWICWDTARTPNNQTKTIIRTNASTAEATASEPFEKDLVSNGFTTRSTSTVTNTNGTKFYYLAFAEHPFKTARAQ